MKKEVIKKFGKNYYLLGVNWDDEKVYLCEGSFDCNWYWGIGYVNTFNKWYSDINMHTHFDTLFFNGTKCCNGAFQDYFKDTTVDDKELWKLLELMKSIYTMREYSDFIYTGGAHITSNMFKDDIKNESEYKRINEELIPKMLQEVYKILGGNE